MTYMYVICTTHNTAKQICTVWGMQASVREQSQWAYSTSTKCRVKRCSAKGTGKRCCESRTLWLTVASEGPSNNAQSRRKEKGIRDDTRHIILRTASRNQYEACERLTTKPAGLPNKHSSHSKRSGTYMVRGHCHSRARWLAVASVAWRVLRAIRKAKGE